MMVVFFIVGSFILMGIGEIIYEQFDTNRRIKENLKHIRDRNVR